MKFFPGPRFSAMKKLERNEFLKSKPFRNPALRWEEKEGRVRILLPPLERKKKIIRRLLGIPEKKAFYLDEVGSEVWKRCDGKSQVLDIVRFLKERYNLSRKEAEVSTLEYIVRLWRRGLIELRGGNNG